MTEHFPQTEKARNRAPAWLINGLDEEGLWQNDAFVPGFVPTYYARSIWAILQMENSIRSIDNKEIMRKSLQAYAARFLSNAAGEDAGFRSADAAFTHTLVCTSEGFWESVQMLGEPQILD